MRKIFLFYILLLSFPGIYQPASAQNGDRVSAIIRERIEAEGYQGTLRVADTRIFSKSVLPDFYRRRKFTPAWTNKVSIADAVESIRNADKEGLLPNDYHLAAITKLQYEIASTTNPSPGQLADLDMLLTDGVILYASHLLSGKVNPQITAESWNYDRRFIREDTVMVLQNAIVSASLAAELERFKPSHPAYRQLKDQLAFYRNLAASGGWPKVGNGPNIEPGMSDKRMPAVRKRLQTEGFTSYLSDSLRYEEELTEAVKEFQRRYGLPVTGVIGKQTAAAMDEPVEALIDKIKVNLERLRWVTGNLGQDYVLVNIPEFKLYMHRGGELLWETEVVVGTQYQETPVFKAKIQYLELNPTWTVPSGITQRDILPAVKKSRNYLTEKQIDIIDRQGNKIDPATINWSQTTIRNFPYVFRQVPGSNNALGRVKFMFPNKYAVYLHDTPSRALFERSERAFSNGCVRVKNPLHFTELLLNDPEKWNAAQIDRAIKSGRTQAVFLKEPIDILIMYLTAGFDGQDCFFFRKDIYNRDKKVLVELEERIAQ